MSGLLNSGLLFFALVSCVARPPAVAAVVAVVTRLDLVVLCVLISGLTFSVFGASLMLRANQDVEGHRRRRRRRRL